MARIAMVTRTIITTEVEVLCMNIETVAVEPQTFTLLGAIPDEATALKKIKDLYETETLKPVHIQSTKEIETLYGLTEEDFVKLAKILPPRKGTSDNSEAQPDETSESTPESTPEVTPEESPDTTPDVPEEESKKSSKSK